MAKLGYIKQPGVTSLSYSRQQVLHECPRKFQLREKYSSGTRSATVHTEFGHALACMIQEYFTSKNANLAIVCGMAAWDLDLWEVARGKSVKCWEEVLIAFDKFVSSIYPQHFEGVWEIADLGEGKPAVELLYYINILNRYSHQGHIDLLLQTCDTKSLAVWELKTSEQNLHPAKYQNSSQAVTYSLVLDHLAKELGRTTEDLVGYLAYNPKQEDNFGYTIFNFPQGEHAKIDAINTILLDCKAIDEYEGINFYPKNGDSCWKFFKPCEFFGCCDLRVIQEEDTAYTVLPLEAADIVINITDIAALN